MRLYSTANERGLTSQPPFWLPCGNMQAGRPRSVGLVCFSGSQAFCLCFFRFVGETHLPPDRGRLACKRLYSTANERFFDLNRLLVALRQHAGGTPAIRWSYLLFRIACYPSQFFVIKKLSLMSLMSHLSLKKLPKRKFNK
ncbi:MAG: hypothetical protein LBP59_06470 [Planctomycetaceae bacterium]|nr:hypothetical protein [Planctomycetaceae bacterium]